jgi:glycosyltransferase involved in cell wall biosynthesis
MLDFCVAIRTCNGEKYLSEILDALKAQQGLEDIIWEVLIVDNCSDDGTAKIVHNYQKQWTFTNPLRYCFEPVKGASFARRRAIEEANAPLIGFLDDDNVPDAHWIRAAINFARQHPRAAAFGGQIHGKFEVSPPQNFALIAGYLPVVERGNSVCFTQGKYNKLNVLPPGAGLVVRRQLWLDLVPEKQILRGPVGNSLSLKGEDIEALMYLKRAGWQIWFNANTHIYHHIPAARLEREYLMRFFKGIGLGRYHTRTVGYPNWHKPFVAAAYMLNDLRKLVDHWFKYHREIPTDAVLAGKFELYRSSFISPLYHFKAYFSCLLSEKYQQKSRSN